LDLIGWDDCDPVFLLATIAAQLMLVFSNNDL